MQNKYTNVRFNKNNGTYTAFVDVRGRVLQDGKWRTGVIRRESNSTFTCPHLAAAWREDWLDDNPDVDAPRNTVAPQHWTRYWKQYKEGVVRRLAALKADRAKYVVDLPGEYWAEIPGFGGQYKVSQLARVASKYEGGWKLVGSMSGEYPRVTLTRPDGGLEYVAIHRLVAEAFVPKPSIELNTVNHKNGNKMDSRAVNLEWCDPRHNVLHSIRVLGKPAFGTRRGPIPVQDQFGTVYPSQSAAGKATGNSQAAVAAVLSPACRAKSAKGFRFTRVDEAPADVQ